jgi:hypothetical protein
MFGVDETKFGTGPYYDLRHIDFFGAIIEPSGIKATEASVTCFPEVDLIGASLKPIRRFGDRLSPTALPVKIRPVGHVHYRGKEYSANLRFPADVLVPILQMMIAEKYRYVIFEAAPGGRDAEIFNFRFAGHDARDDDIGDR